MLVPVYTTRRFTYLVVMEVSVMSADHTMTSIALILKLRVGKNLFQTTPLQMEEVD
jgi:hypothetical protein